MAIKVNESGLRNVISLNGKVVSNLERAKALINSIQIPKKFSYSATLTNIPNQIEKIENNINGINDYIDKKIDKYKEAERKAAEAVGNVRQLMYQMGVGSRFEIKDGETVTQYPGRDGIVTVREKNIVDKYPNNPMPNINNLNPYNVKKKNNTNYGDYSRTASKVTKGTTNNVAQPLIYQWYKKAKDTLSKLNMKDVEKNAKDMVQGAKEGLEQKANDLIEKIKNFDLKKTAAQIGNMNGSDIMNLIIAGGKGVAKVGEETADAYQIMSTNSFENNPDVIYYYGGDKNKIQEGQKLLQRDTMAMVSVQHVDTIYNDFYKNTDFGKSLDKNANDNFKSDGKYTKWVETRAHQATIFTVGGIAGPLGVGVLGGMSGKGRAAESVWANTDVKSMIDKKADIDTLDDIYKKVDKYSSIIGAYTGASMAFQKSTGSGGKVDKVLNNVAKRILADGVVGSTEPIVNAVAESQMTRASFKETFEKNGGWNAVGEAFTGAAFDSAVGELKGWFVRSGNNKLRDATGVDLLYEKAKLKAKIANVAKSTLDDIIHPKDRIIATPGLYEAFDNIGNSIRNLFKRSNSDNNNGLNESQLTQQAIENEAIELSKKFEEEKEYERTGFPFGFRENKLDKLRKVAEDYNTYSTIRLRGKQDGTVEVYPWDVDENEVQQTLKSAYIRMSEKMILEGKTEEKAFSEVLESFEKITENSKNNLLEREIAPYYGTPKFISDRSNYIIKCMDTILNDDSASSNVKEATALVIDDAKRIANEIGIIGQNISSQRNYEEYDKMKSNFEKLLSYEDKVSEEVQTMWNEFLTDPKDYKEGEPFAFFVHAFSGDIKKLKPNEKLCCTLVTEKCMPIPYGDYGIIANPNSGKIVTMCTEDAGSWPISKAEFIDRGFLPDWQFAERSGDDGDRIFFEIPNVSKLILPSTMEREMIKNNLKYGDGRCDSYSEIYMTTGNNGENIEVQELFYIDEEGKTKTKPINDGYNPIKLDPTKGTVAKRTRR